MISQVFGYFPQIFSTLWIWKACELKFESVKELFKQTDSLTKLKHFCTAIVKNKPIHLNESDYQKKHLEWTSSQDIKHLEWTDSLNWIRLDRHKSGVVTLRSNADFSTMFLMYFKLQNKYYYSILTYVERTPEDFQASLMFKAQQLR